MSQTNNDMSKAKAIAQKLYKKGNTSLEIAAHLNQLNLKKGRFTTRHIRKMVGILP